LSVAVWFTVKAQKVREITENGQNHCNIGYSEHVLELPLD